MHSVQNQKPSSFHRNQEEDFPAITLQTNNYNRHNNTNYNCSVLTKNESHIKNWLAPLNLCGTHPYYDNVQLHL